MPVDLSELPGIADRNIANRISEYEKHIDTQVQRRYVGEPLEVTLYGIAPPTAEEKRWLVASYARAGWQMVWKSITMCVLSAVTPETEMAELMRAKARIEARMVELDAQMMGRK